MPHAALYFPYIEVPDKPSLTRVLLYWDQLGTVVPAAVPRLSRPTQELVDYGLVERIDPAPYVHEIDGFTEGFLRLLDGVQLENFGGYERLHRRKVPYGWHLTSWV